jgi:KDO2-lipid IV(A) lauroyltransferase
MAARRDMMARHLRRVFGPLLGHRELEAKVDEAFGSYARYWADSLRLPGLSFEAVEAGMSWQGIGHIYQGLEAGRGVILALPHLGGWEWAGAWIVGQGYPMTVVVEALEPPELFEWFAGFRRSVGMEVVGVGPEAATAVLRALRANHVVSLLSDRNLTGAAGVDVAFFGERTSLPGGPATLALRTGAALLPTAVYFEAGPAGHLGLVQSPIDTARRGSLREDVARVTQELAERLEGLIKRRPTQWHLMQPNWPSDSDGAAGP